MLDHGSERRLLDLWRRTGNGAARGGSIAIEALTGDVSPRRYYRVTSGRARAIAAIYPPDLRPVAARFRRTSDLLAGAGVRVPAILGVDEEGGLMLLEDVGAETLFDWRARSWSALAPYLQASFAAARRVRQVDPEAVAALLPPLDAAALERELALTWDAFLLPHDLVAGEELRRRLRDCLESLCAALEAEGLVPCHRDFMARNLVPLAGELEVAVLDHQDLRLGPRAYDAASLCNDSLYPPDETIGQLLGAELHHSAGYHRAVVQRTLKIVGTFASFARRGERRYLPLVAPSLARCLAHLAVLPEGETVAADLRPAWSDALSGRLRLLE